MSEPVNALASAAGVLTINGSLGSYFTFTPTENVTSTVFANVNPAQTFAIRFQQHAIGGEDGGVPGRVRLGGRHDPARCRPASARWICSP